jgi:hypothetical protein
MANTLILKRSSDVGKVPTAQQLQVGELAVNLSDKKLYSKNATGEVILVGSGSAIDETKLPLAGGTMTGQLTGITSGSSTVASFAATTTGGSYASVYTRRGVPFYSTSSDSGSSYKPSVNMQYTHNDAWAGVYSLGVLNESAADPGSFNILHINSEGGQQVVWGFQGHTGNFTSPGNVNSTSDERLKTNWRTLPDNFLESLSKVKHGIYDRVDSGLTQAGVSAQDMQKVLEQVVSEDSEGMLSVNYGNAALVAVIELTKKVLELKEEIKALKAK